MSKIKINSNPYEKRISYAVWDNNNSWKEINTWNNPNSRLLRKNFCENFFPFCIEDVMEEIYDSYYSLDEPVTIVFTGIADEFEELRSYCSKHPEKNILTQYSECKLNDAKKVLPEIIEIFNKVKPFAEEVINVNPTIKDDMNNFSNVLKEEEQEKYSLYNKCYKSRKFLESIIQKTKDEFKSQKREVEEERNELRSDTSLGDTKKRLIEELNKRKSDPEEWKNYYDLEMNQFLGREINKAFLMKFNEILGEVVNYDEYMRDMQSRLQRHSVDYWQQKEDILKKRIARIFNNPEIEKKKEFYINSKILDCEELYEGAKSKGFFSSLFKSDAEYIFKQAKENLRKMMETLKLRHYYYFCKKWVDFLYEVKSEMAKLDPELKAKVGEKTDNINSLQANLDKLEELADSIKRKITLHN